MIVIDDSLESYLMPDIGQADSKTIRKVMDYYRLNGRDAHADYLQTILDEREGFEERGGPGSGHFGHAGRPGEVGGSAEGEGGGRVARQMMPSDFHAAFEAAMSGHPMSQFVSHYSVKELVGMDTVLLTEDGKAGMAVKNHQDGRIEGTALFNVSGIPGLGKAILQQAIEEYGVNYVEAFGPRLPKIYETLGFRTIEKFKFDAEQAPEGWDYERFGRPDYHVMMLPRKKGGYAMGVFESLEVRGEATLEEILAKFDEGSRRLDTEPEVVLAEIDAELIAEHGQEWFDANKKYIDANTAYARELLGF